MTEFVIKGEVEKRVWHQKSLRFNVMIQIAGADVQIQNLDIDFDIYKTNKSEPNKSTITIWNLNDTTYQRIVEKTYALDLYTWYGEDEPALMFRGYIDKDRIRQDYLSSNRATVIELTDGKLAYTDTKINKNYREPVSSTQIIKDCVEALGVGISKFSEDLPEKIYPNFKAVGKPHVILEQVARPLGIDFSIQNDLIQVISPDEKFAGEFAVLLNPSNSLRPERQGENEIVISTRLINFINPNDWVRCEFKEFEGTERVRQIRSTGNNYGTAGRTEITIGFDKVKKKSETL